MHIVIALAIGLFTGVMIGVCIGALLAAASESYSGPVAKSDSRETGLLS